jgi:hypothetical protein
LQFNSAQLSTPAAEADGFDARDVAAQ